MLTITNVIAVFKITFGVCWNQQKKQEVDRVALGHSANSNTRMVEGATNTEGSCDFPPFAKEQTGFPGSSHMKIACQSVPVYSPWWTRSGWSATLANQWCRLYRKARSLWNWVHKKPIAGHCHQNQLNYQIILLGSEILQINVCITLMFSVCARTRAHIHTLTHTYIYAKHLDTSSYISLDLLITLCYYSYVSLSLYIVFPFHIEVWADDRPLEYGSALGFFILLGHHHILLILKDFLKSIIRI